MLPRPSSPSTAIVPWCAATMALVMVGPSPVRMTCCSSWKAAEACWPLKTSKSVFPINSPATRPGAYAAIQPALTRRNRLCMSLKYTRSPVADSRLRMQVSSSPRCGSLASRHWGGSLTRAIAPPEGSARSRCRWT